MGLEILHKNNSMLADMCRRHHVRKLSVFGSFARGDYEAGRSDIDLLVEFDEHLAPADYARAYFGLKEALETTLGANVDLVTPSAFANPYLRTDIHAAEKSLYAA